MDVFAPLGTFRLSLKWKKENQLIYGSNTENMADSGRTRRVTEIFHMPSKISLLIPPAAKHSQNMPLLNGWDKDLQLASLFLFQQWFLLPNNSRGLGDISPICKISGTTFSCKLWSGIFVSNLHCIIHQKSQCKSVLQLGQVVKPVVKLLNFIWATGLQHCQFIKLLEETDADHLDFLYHFHVRYAAI